MVRPRLVLVLGTPGVGKTAVARGLAKELGLRFVDLGTVVKRQRLYSNYDTNRASYVASESRIRHEWARIAGKGAVVATHFLTEGMARGFETVSVVLRLDPLVLWRRLRARGWSRSKAWENVESELLDVCYFEAHGVLNSRRVFELDTTRKSRSKTLREVSAFVNGRTRAQIRRVDWLRIYDPIEIARRFGIG